MDLILLSLLLSLFSPLFLLVIEQAFRLPASIEELFKALIVVIIIKGETKIKKKVWPFVFFAAYFFTISESILYLNNLFILNAYGIILLRLFATGLLHLITMSLIYFGGRKNYILFGSSIIIAVLIHQLYNSIIT